MITDPAATTNKARGETPHMEGVGMLVGNFEVNPERRPIWAWPKHFFTPKTDHVKTQTNGNTWII